MMKAREFVSPITINVRIKMSMLYVIAIVPKALTCRDGAPPNHQVQLRCNTGGASPHFLEKKNHATSNSLTLDNMRKAQTKKLFIFP